MNTAWLEDLIALSEHMSFSRAAEQRNITQPAFGRRIAALENWFGVTLVDRSSHRIELTEAGKIVLGSARDILARHDQTRSQIDQLRAKSTSLVFASTHALSFSFFPDWIRTLGTEAASIPFHLLSDNMKACERLMRDGRAQFLLCHHRAGSEIDLPLEDYRFIELAKDTLVPVSRRQGDGKPSISLDEGIERKIELLAFDDRSGMGRILRSAISQRLASLPTETFFHRIWRWCSKHCAAMARVSPGCR